MALGTNSNQRPPTTYVHLGRGTNSGFRHNAGSTTDAAGVVTKIVNTYDFVTGKIAGLYLDEELVYEVSKKLRENGGNPKNVDLSTYQDYEKQYVASLMLKDPDSEEVVSVGFEVGDSMGGKIIGMLNAMRLNGTLDQMVKIRTYYSPPKSKYNVSEKGRDSVNMAPFDPLTPDVKGEDIKPIFLDADGLPWMKEDGITPEMLPMGTVVKIPGRKDVWDFSLRDGIILETALTLFEHFEAQKKAHKQGHNDHDDHDDHDDGGVDLSEAAAAASAPSHS